MLRGKKRSSTYKSRVTYASNPGSLRGSAAGITRKYIKRGFAPGRKLKSKSYGSYLSSKRVVVPTAQGGDTSSSACVITHVQKKKTAAVLMKQLGAPNFYIRQVPLQSIAAQGFQKAVAFQWNGVQDLLYMNSKVPNNISSSALVTNFGTQRYELSKMTGELLFTNSSLASSYVEIYDIVSRRDSPAFTGGAGSLNLADPVNCWNQGVSDITAGIPTSNTWTVIKSLPFDSQLFNDYFKVVRRHHVGMPQGATHRHTVDLGVDKVFDAELLQSITGASALYPDQAQNTLRNMRGVTMWTMVVHYGQPASAATDAGAVVTTAKIALDFVQSLRYKYTYIQDTTRNAVITDSLQSLANEQVVSRGSGLITTNAIA